MYPDANHSAYAASPGQGKDSRPRDRHSFALESVGGARYFSTLGLASGYWQVKVDPTDRPKTAFTMPQGLNAFWGFAMHLLCFKGLWSTFCRDFSRNIVLSSVL